MLVVTHEHWDYVSGFLTAAEQFKKLKIDRVWMAWTEDPDDADAKSLDKFRADATNTLQLAASRLEKHTYRDKSRTAVKAGLNILQGFTFGAAGEKVRSARDAAKALGRNGVRYLQPGETPFDFDGVNGVKVYVLGPPRRLELLKLTTRASEMYGISLAPGWKASQALHAAPGLGGTEADPFMPFGTEEGDKSSSGDRRLSCQSSNRHTACYDRTDEALPQCWNATRGICQQGKAPTRSGSRLAPH